MKKEKERESERRKRWELIHFIGIAKLTNNNLFVSTQTLNEWMNERKTERYLNTFVNPHFEPTKAHKYVTGGMDRNGLHVNANAYTRNKIVDGQRAIASAYFVAAAIPLLYFLAQAFCLNVSNMFHSEQRFKDRIEQWESDLFCTGVLQVDLANNRSVRCNSKLLKKRKKKIEYIFYLSLFSKMRIWHIFERHGNDSAFGAFIKHRTQRETEMVFFLSFPHFNNLEQSRTHLINSAYTMT